MFRPLVLAASLLLAASPIGISAQQPAAAATAVASSTTWPIESASADVKPILTEIRDKLEAVEEYSIKRRMTLTVTEGANMTTVTEDIIASSQPDKLRTRSVVTEASVPALKGTTTDVLVVGKTLYNITQMSPNALETMPGFAQMQPQQQQMMRDQMLQPQVTKCDLARLEAAGIPLQTLNAKDPLLVPFADVPGESIRLEKEEGGNWYLNSNFDLAGEYLAVRWMIDKNSGFIEAVEVQMQGIKFLATYDAPQINPGLAPSAFEFKPPAGVPVQDTTDIMLQAAQMSQNLPSSLPRR